MYIYMSFLNSDIKLVMTRYKFTYLIIYIRPNKLKLKLKPEDRHSFSFY